MSPVVSRTLAYGCLGTLAVTLLVSSTALPGCKTEPPPIPVPGDPDPKPDPKPDPQPEPDGKVSAELQKLFDLHNQDRKAQGLKPVALQGQAIKAAQKHADWMAARGIMSHTGKNGSSFWQRLTAEGYRGTGGGENIAAGYRDPKSVMQGWLNSPGHRDNIRNPQWQHVGLGVTTANNGKRYWCAVFGRGGNSALSEGDVQLVLMLPEPLEATEAESSE